MRQEAPYLGTCLACMSCALCTGGQATEQRRQRLRRAAEAPHAAVIQAVDDPRGEVVALQAHAGLCAALGGFGQALARRWGLPEAVGRFSQASALAVALIVEEAMQALHASGQGAALL